MHRLRALAVVLTLAAPAFGAVAAEKSLSDRLIEIIDRDGIESGVEAYRTLDRKSRPSFVVEEQQLSLVGARMLARGRYEDAASFFAAALVRFPGSSRLTFAMAEACFRAERLDEAQTWYERSRRLIPLDRRIDSSLRRSMTMVIRIRLQRLKYDPLFQRYAGVYRLEDGRILAVSPTEVDGRQLLHAMRLVEHPAGRVRTLYPSNSTTFAAGPALMVPEPEELRVVFDARHAKIRVVDRVTRRTFEGSRLELGTEHPVTITNRSVTLAGSVTHPVLPGPHPAVVMLHGSGSAGRNNPAFADLANVLLMNGFAVLRHDKRGVGNSTGDWRNARTSDLVSDALAAVEFLRGCAAIDQSRIGLLGFSQGAWIAGLAAAKDPGIGFVALVSGGAVPPRDQATYRVG
ncbi:MAG: alpha/beta fold hydrolase, partial [Thermoanaerobaculia bacterium]